MTFWQLSLLFAESERIDGNPVQGGIVGNPLAFVRTEQYKLYRDGRFYDVTTDVLETKPLASTTLSQPQQQVKLMLKKTLEQMPSGGRSLLKYGS